MKVYLGFDDTDTKDAEYGTGKLVRWFLEELPDGCACRGVVRQQLLVNEFIPYTSHNSAACMIVDMPDLDLLDEIIARAVRHLERHAIEGSDPGFCAAAEDDPALDRLEAFGRHCAHMMANQAQAMKAAGDVHLSGHGGTNDGVIGAAAAVGLTASGWAGRYIELGSLRDFPGEITVMELKDEGVDLVSMDRDCNIPAPRDRVVTNGWLRPRLLGHRPVLFVRQRCEGVWEHIYAKREKIVPSLNPDPALAPDLDLGEPLTPGTAR